ncbi:glycosyltransferase family 4 protein [Haloferula rosea]|uniref:Glycosyltransferase family 4 protein n=1 Tax=Haloferula rosea TaxID=490093 RepID=A0A934VG86_9BACT|nr:glycosyltransferase family 4 protein [Haloferula rosea]MBK1827821.1 glycosyltransferase family 4 protein [Haloferula rosea]
MADVVIIQEHLPHYRVAFFEGLRASLLDRGLSLALVYGRKSDSRMITTPLPWATGVDIRRFGPFAWHALAGACAGSRLIIVPQEIKYLRCHLLWLTSRFARRPVFAYWGHGRNFQAENPNSVSERIKALLSRRVDWWFAYNDLSAEVVGALGFDPGRITVVGNTVDTATIKSVRAEVSEADLVTARAKLGIGDGPVALYAGALYDRKRIPFLLAAAKQIKEAIPDFHLLVMGDGPQADMIKQASVSHPWIHHLGPLRDREKAVYWELSELLLMPGLVGLVVVDTFLFGVPMVTTDYPNHSPEIDYLKSGVNGLKVDCGEDSGTYARAVIDLLSRPEKVEKLSAAALESAEQHHLSGMIRRFADGIMEALEVSGIKEAGHA